MSELPEARQELMAKCIKLRIEGYSYDEMATILNSDYTTCRKAVKEALAQTVTELADEVRQLELNRLDGMLLAHWPNREHPRHADVILKIQDRRAKFLGLDTPSTDLMDGATALRDFLRAAGNQLGVSIEPPPDDPNPFMDHSRDK